jgi:dihydrolipoamide dehydrogenase
MAETPDAVQLAVIGAGPGGYGAAFLAADFGLPVTLIGTDENPGGVCLYRGCIPSKALLHIAKVIEESEAAASWGVTFDKPRIDLDRVRAWKDDVVGKLTGGLGELSKRRKVQYLRGMARFEGARSLSVSFQNGNTERVDFTHAIIATGSSPAVIPGFDPDSPRVWDSTSALDLPDVPSRLLVIGGGYIGLELGSVYAALGSKVTVVEMLDSILPGVDSDLVRPLERKLQKSFAAIHTATKVKESFEHEEGFQVSFEGAYAGTETFDRVLVAVGRRPLTKGLGLDAVRVALNERGFIEVSRHRETTELGIFAIGDVAGEPMLAHKATHEGRAAVETISGRHGMFEPRAIPAVIFTDPEIAWAGLTETEAKKAGRAIEVGRFPWAASGRSITLGRTEGVTKVIVEPESKRVLGVGICGPGAGELIAEAVLAIEMGATAQDLELTIHPHPTLSETIMEAAASIYGTATDIYRPRRG